MVKEETEMSHYDHSCQILLTENQSRIWEMLFSKYCKGLLLSRREFEARCSTVVEVLYYKPENREFETQCE
jgi:hypothetical protein